MRYLILAALSSAAIFSNSLHAPQMDYYIKTPITLEERAARKDYDRRRGLYTECKGYEGDWTKGGLPESGDCVRGVWVPPHQKPIPKCGTRVTLEAGRWYTHRDDLKPRTNHRVDPPRTTPVPQTGGGFAPGHLPIPGHELPGHTPPPIDHCYETPVPPTPVPLGSTLWLMLVGLISMRILRRKNK